ncbi:hypothetical protein ANN_17350 [Periplaneta americana]|uniref:Uncharacterized protein n=1 Tax=Periplaneta americana TaxID=6978 RepID=A0ABQ8SSP6_PERAM|nr:hypothetical protein ANN_17350 [Periplaneta americana]
MGMQKEQGKDKVNDVNSRRRKEMQEEPGECKENKGKGGIEVGQWECKKNKANMKIKAQMEIEPDCITLRHRLRNEDIRIQTHLKDTAETADKLKKKWAGYVMRFNENRWTHILTTWDPRIGKRNAGRQKTRWADELRSRFSHLWSRTMKDRQQWKLITKSEEVLHLVGKEIRCLLLPIVETATQKAYQGTDIAIFVPFFNIFATETETFVISWDDREFQTAAKRWFRAQAADFHDTRIQKLIP